jgi:hypothetical protein
MRYQVGLGVGHVYAQRQASNSLDPETVDSTPHGDDAEVDPIIEIPDDGDEHFMIPIAEESSSSEFGGEGEEADDDEDTLTSEDEFLEEDVYEF